eukprot:GHVP01061968.1.p1 GENE.GHVP01061968.1~~GHVP01061968.1.p1  ORF type:complete len:130 (-),score=13.28 GHVP01061968.1:677-1066(-)
MILLQSFRYAEFDVKNIEPDVSYFFSMVNFKLLLPGAAGIAAHTTPTPTPTLPSTTTPTALLTSFVPESSSPKIKKGFTTPEVRAYRKWCNDLKRHKKIEICPKPKYIADANLVKKKDGTFRVNPTSDP